MVVTIKTALNKPSDAASPSVDPYIQQLELSKKRWLILFIFCMMTFANTLLATSVVPINDIARKYYNVDSTVIDWLPNSGNLVLILIVFPTAYLLQSMGLRDCMLAATSFNAICACLNVAGVDRNHFFVVLVGRLFCGLATGVALQLPARLSTVWFATNEHAAATSIGIFANTFGTAIGFVQSTNMVPSNGIMSDVKTGFFYMYLTQLIFCLVNLILVYVFFAEEPFLPPTFTALLTSASNQGDTLTMPFKESLKKLASDINMILLTQAYGLSFGLCSVLLVSLNEMVSQTVSESEIGWMGFSFTCFGIVGMIITGFIIDKYRCFKLLGCLLMLGTLVSWITFTMLMIHTNSTVGLFVAYSCTGFFGTTFTSVGIEQASEMTYPVPEGTSTGVIMGVSYIYSFIAILLLGKLFDHGNKVTACYIVAVICAVVFVLLACVKVRLRRQEEEQRHAVTNIDFLQY